MAQDDTIVMVLLGVVLTLAAGIGGAIVFQKRPTRPSRVPVEDESLAYEEPSTTTSSAKKKKKKSKGGADDVIDETRANLPVLSIGTKCYHRQAKEWCTVVKVFYDDMPPYYAVTFEDGSERATVRARLETAAEREAEKAAAERAEAEKRAAAAAAELLAEEAAQTRRKPTSGGDKKSKKR